MLKDKGTDVIKFYILMLFYNKKFRISVKDIVEEVPVSHLTFSNLYKFIGRDCI